MLWAFRSHDARLVALMKVHGITHVLTLNPIDFARYAEITAITPSRDSALYSLKPGESAGREQTTVGLQSYY